MFVGVIIPSAVGGCVFGGGLLVFAWPVAYHVWAPPAERTATPGIFQRFALVHLDETYVKVGGRWCYLYRAIDHRGDLIDSMLSERRDKHAARMFLRRLLEVAGARPPRITTDLHPAYQRAIRWIIGRKAWHQTTQYLNNYTEQSHRAVKQRYYPMLGFGSFESASRFCSAFDELRQYLRVRRRGESQVSLAEQRRLFLTRWRSLIGELAAV
jgi:transposase-like protein